MKKTGLKILDKVRKERIKKETGLHEKCDCPTLIKSNKEYCIYCGVEKNLFKGLSEKI